MAEAPIFVVGAPRSGTHLVRFCLSRHSRLHIAPESGFFIQIYGNRRLLAPRRIADAAPALVDRILRSGDPTMEAERPFREELIARVRDGTGSYRALAEAVFGFMAERRGKVRWGEKTPLHALYIPQIRALFPEARIVYVHRDPRNVVASYLRSPLLPDDLALAIVHTRMSVMAGRRAVERGWAWPVAYEALVERPEAVLRGLADYVGEDFEAAMLEPGMRDSSYGSGELMQREPGRGIEKDPDEADKWRSVLSEREGALVQALVEGTRGPTPPWSLRVKVARTQLFQGIMHTRNRWGLHGLKRPFPGGGAR